MLETATERLHHVHQRLLKTYGEPPKIEHLPILEALAFAILVEGPSFRKANAVWRTLRETFSDLNELRAASPRTVSRVCASLDDGTRKSVRLRRILQVIINETEEVTLEPWAHVGAVDLKRRILLLPGTNPFHAACVVLAVKGTAVVYLSDDGMRLLKRLHVFPKDAPPTRMQDAIAKVFPLKISSAFQQLLQAHALSVCAPEPRCGSCVLAEHCPSKQSPVPAHPIAAKPPAPKAAPSAPKAAPSTPKAAPPAPKAAPSAPKAAHHAPKAAAPAPKAPAKTPKGA